MNYVSPQLEAAAASNRSESDVRAARPTFKLVDETTGEEIPLPARRTCWDGAEIIVRDFKPSRYEGNQGYIYTTLNETYVPSVIGAKIIEFPVSELDQQIGGGGL